MKTQLLQRAQAYMAALNRLLAERGTYHEVEDAEEMGA